MTVVFKFRHKKIAIFFFIFASCSLTLLNAVSVSAGPLRNALGQIPGTVPAETSNYLSLMTGGTPPKVNGNSKSYADDQESPSVVLKVYAINPNQRTVRLDFVKRDVGSESACENFQIHWVLRGLSANERAWNGITATADSPVQGSAGPNDCNGRYALITIPAGVLGPSALSNHFDDTDTLHTGLLELSIKTQAVSGVTNNRSPTFKASLPGSCSNCAKLGYAGDIGAFDPRVAIYPSNLANGNGIDFYFAPPCNASAGLKQVEWEDTDRGVANENQDINSNFKNNVNYTPGSDSVTGRTGQINGLEADIVDAVDGVSARVGVPNYGGSGSGNIRFTHQLGHIYKLQFSNVTGGNRVIFNMPYDSGDFYFICQLSAWKLDPDTTQRVSQIGYAAAYNPPTNQAEVKVNVDRAKVGFESARFRHFVNELDNKTDALSGDHNWKIQFQMRRATAGAWDGPHTKPPPLNNLTATVPKKSFVTLENDSRANVNSSEMEYLFGNSAAWRNPNMGDGDINTNDGDQYCERLNNISYDTSKGTVVDDPSSWKCFELTNTPPPVCEPWTLGSSKSITGDGDPDDAWPGQTFSFNYSFWNKGPADRTSNVDFYHNTLFPNKTHSQVFDPRYNPSRSVTIGPGDAPGPITDRIEWTPNEGYADCATGPGGIMTQQINVPYYFHLKPSSDGLPDKTQQGDAVTPKLAVSLPELDSQGDLSGEAASDNEYGGRPHTDSAPTNWRIIEFKTSNVDSAKSTIPKNRSGSSGDCGEMSGFGIPGFADCGNVAAGNQVFPVGTANFSYTRPGNTTDPVDTKICYVGVVSAPTHTGTPGSRYSNVLCTTIVKSPKVQFLNGDLTVGRHRLTDGGTPCAPPVSTAAIQATGAPGIIATANPPDLNLYGSWVEYGAFATGTISGFGTAAHADIGTSSEEKLMFGNTPSSGGYNYPSDCLSNPFDLVKPPDVTDITAAAANLPLNTYFGSSANDKTGYVSNGQNITLVQAGAPALDNSFDAFRGRDIIIYANDPTDSCSGAANGGTITIKNDITYTMEGYGDVNQLPRIILLADCKIIIEDTVKRVDAWLIAKDAVETCSEVPTGMKFQARTVNQDDCAEQLVINGPVQAKRLLLWRTHGTDLSNAVTAKEAAEIFNLRPDHMLSTFARGRDAGKPTTIYQTDLPPRY